jgi:predicted nuclease with TOPRIM domain
MTNVTPEQINNAEVTDKASEGSPKKLPQELVMQLENLSLKMQNVQLQLQIMQQQLGQAMEAKNKLQGEMEELRQKVIQEHGVDVAHIQLTPDGTIIPVQNPNTLRM